MILKGEQIAHSHSPVVHLPTAFSLHHTLIFLPTLFPATYRIYHKWCWNPETRLSQHLRDWPKMTKELSRRKPTPSFGNRKSQAIPNNRVQNGEYKTQIQIYPTNGTANKNHIRLMHILSRLATPIWIELSQLYHRLYNTIQHLPLHILFMKASQSCVFKISNIIHTHRWTCKNLRQR